MLYDHRNMNYLGITMIKKRKPQYSRTAPIPWNLEPLKGHMWLVILFVVPCTCLAVPGPSTEKQHRMIFSAIKVDEGDIVVRSGEKPGKRSVNWETVRTVNGELVNITWPVKRVASEEGDIILGGLMMVHEREEESTCGRIMRQGGIQALEAMLYTIDYVNRKQFHNHTSFLPGFTLGAYILDDCDKDTYGLEMAVDFIKGSISSLEGNQVSRCPDGSSPQGTSVRVIPGVVAAASSVTSIQVANLLRLFKIPQISFFSTSSELSNKDRFEYFSRTVPSDANQTRAMVELINLLKWTYISIVYEESAYGLQAFAALQQLLEESKVCLAAKEKLPKDSRKAREQHYDELVDRLKLKPQAKGVIVYGSDQEVAELMRAIGRRNATGMFTWIGSDGWSARTLVSDGNEMAVEGTLSFQPLAHPVHGFQEYFKELTVFNNKRNPWFVEYWEDMFQCKFPDSPLTPHNVQWEEECMGEETYSGPFTLELEGQLQFVSDAVMAFAHALKSMHRDLCPGYHGLCDEMDPIDGPTLLRYLRKVRFTGLSGDEFEFDEVGDGPPRYTIVHFRRLSSFDPPRWGWVPVGEYHKSGLTLNWTEIRFNDRDTGHERIPESVCGRPCGAGQAKNILPNENCCWLCVNCTDYQYLASESECMECRLGTLPNPNKTACREIPSTYLTMDSYWAIGVLSLSSVGLLLTIWVIVVFIKYSETNVVKASGRELSYVLLGGIMLCYAMTGLLLLKPCDIVCGVQMFAIGICFAVCYSALLTKTNRIARIFQAGKQSARRPSFISPKSQLVICAGLVSFQVSGTMTLLGWVTTTTWYRSKFTEEKLPNGMFKSSLKIVIIIVYMAYSPPVAESYYPTREDNVLVCRSHVDTSYMIAFAYPILLLLVCTIYAVLTRKIPEAFNESQHIGFTTYTTCIIWLAFVPIFFSTATNIPLRITTLCASISLSGTVSLACLFAPKMYIILVHPERNVRQSLMTSAKYNATKTNTTSLISHTSQSQSADSISACNIAETNHRPQLLVPAATTDSTSMDLEEEPSVTENGPQIPVMEIKPVKSQLVRGHLGSFSTNSTQTLSNDLSFDGDSLSSIEKDFPASTAVQRGLSLQLELDDVQL